MSRVPVPTTLDELEALVNDIWASGVAPISKFKLANIEDATQNALALLGLERGRNVGMLRTIAGDLPMVNPGKEVIFSLRKSDDSYVFANEFDQLKATLFTEIVRRLKPSR